ncbi:MAG: ABC transporter permease [Lachnospiraceae bacterium]|nr:ABC transporter permease [Lachnospiraceae bacterium]
MTGIVQEQKGIWDRPTLVKEGGCWAKSDIQQIRESEDAQEIPMDFTAWGQRNAQMITGNGMERQEEGKVLELMGSSANVLRGGTVLQAEDKEGCLIGSTLAQKLFGSTEAKGQYVRYGERNLRIAGVLESYPNVLVVQWDGVHDSVLNRISISGEAQSTIDAFSLRNSITPVRAEYSMWKDEATLLYNLLPFSFLLWMVYVCLHMRREWISRKGYALPLYLVMLAAVVIFFRCFPIDLESLRDFMPGKWSDFSYYGTYIQSKMQAADLLDSMEKTVVEQAMTAGLMPLKGLVLVGELIFLDFCVKYRKK